MSSRRGRFELEWGLILLLTDGIVYGIESTWLEVLFIVPWSIHTDMPIDVIMHDGNHGPCFRRRIGAVL
ncbi:MAG TPA: hypothetical protein PKA58_13675 [Polyangium sp.]|nr:hypothetical protein [Polyangium sp.]